MKRRWIVKTYEWVSGSVQYQPFSRAFRSEWEARKLFNSLRLTLNLISKELIYDSSEDLITVEQWDLTSKGVVRAV